MSEDSEQLVLLPDDDGLVEVSLRVNGRDTQVRVGTAQTLLEALRETMRLHGARSGCGVGMCGACTVLRDDVPVSGCLTLAALCSGSELETVEGLSDGDGSLSAVQEAFLRHRAFQCSYCTSGFILALEGLLRREPRPTVGQIEEAFSGHICRCGSYSRIMAAADEFATDPEAS